MARLIRTLETVHDQTTKIQNIKAMLDESWLDVKDINSGSTDPAAEPWQLSIEFPCHAWFTVPQSNEIVDLLKTMIKKICQAEKWDTGEIDTANRQELISILLKSLRSRWYFLVFDDVLEEDFWQLLKDALPDNENASIIIITTCSEAVAVSCKETSFDHVHRL
ncbi:hypothetical protein TIFTF001_050445 [Ficus carica]|uniref:NB-ARC domain-containing protein n=1 Tax=Ficus carica TaxID=3494 RepID=A0AA88D4Q9_FICCA|nr:hypothetical protein TIFTF001_050445 [Ficus carica]